MCAQVDLNPGGLECNEEGVLLETLPISPGFWRAIDTSTVRTTRVVLARKFPDIFPLFCVGRGSFLLLSKFSCANTKNKNAFETFKKMKNNVFSGKKNLLLNTPEYDL